MRRPSLPAGLIAALMTALPAALVSATLAAGRAEAQAFNARCAVVRGDTLVEQADCLREVLRTGASEEEGGSGPWIVRYTWATGGTTVTTNVEEFFTINGEPGETVAVATGDWGLCVRNMTSGNTFCALY